MPCSEGKNKSKPVSRVLFPEKIGMPIIYLAVQLPVRSSSLPNHASLRMSRAATSFEAWPIWPFNP